MRHGAGHGAISGLMMREGLLKENIDGEALIGPIRVWRGGPSNARS
jgi:cobalamin biosynthesis protein CobT